jgi:hypothetical protein
VVWVKKMCIVGGQFISILTVVDMHVKIRIRGILRKGQW